MLAQSTGRGRAEAQLTALYEQHAAAVFRYALHLTGRREDAEDVVQHVYIQAYRQLTDGVELVNPLAWLMKAAKYRSLNVIRDRREIPTDGNGFDALAAPDSNRAESEELAAVRSMLWALPEAQHQAFVLRHWSGLSQLEIADVLGTTTSAVESLLVRARGALIDDRDQSGGECRGARGALVDGRPLDRGESAHVDRCRRCRTARSRLLRATEFATAFALVPRPHVAHAIASVVPGFSATAGGIGTAATAATGSTTAGAGAVSSSVPLAAKGGVAAKALVAVVTATVAVSTVQPIRQPILNTIVHHLPGQVSSARHVGASRGDASAAPGPAQSSGGGNSTGVGPPTGVGGRATAPGQAAGHGHSATGKGQGNTHSHAGGNAKTHGKSATAGGNGKAKGKSSTAGGNGNANGKSGGGKGNAKGTAGQGKGKGKTTTTPSGNGNGNGNGNGSGAANGNGKSAGGGNGKSKGTAPAGGSAQPPASNGNGKAKGHTGG
ncbi:MAG TPA: sigma-70 family RNA polymerase sigma factor [Gaiellales bacterium]|nr:sigma-70 family RNA polymerase sigma factor [Gaiellales bacterium]